MKATAHGNDGLRRSMMGARLRTALLVFGLVVSLALGALVALGAAPAAGGTSRGTINPLLKVVVNDSDVDHSDPALSYSTLGWQIEQETCDTLVGYSDHSGSVSSAISPLGAAA